MHLEETDRETDDAIATEAAGEHLVHAALTEKILDYENDAPKRRKFPQEMVHHFPRGHAVSLVYADVDGEAAMSGDEFDDRNLGFRDNCDPVSKPSPFDNIGEGMQHGHLVHTHHRRGIDDEIYVAAYECEQNGDVLYCTFLWRTL